MQMTFEASTAVTLWLKQWHTHSRGTYFVSCVGLVALCLLHEALSAFRTRFHEDFVGNQKGSQYETFAPQTPSDREAQSPITKRYCLLANMSLHFPVACTNLALCSYILQPSSLQVHESDSSKSSPQPTVCTESQLFISPHAGGHDLQCWLFLCDRSGASTGQLHLRWSQILRHLPLAGVGSLTEMPSSKHSLTALDLCVATHREQPGVSNMVWLSS